MGSLERIIDRANERAADAIRAVGREIRLARRDRNLSLAATGRSAGLSPSEVSKIERGLVAGVSILTVVKLGAVVGLDVSIRLFAGGSPVRDDAHAALLAALRARISSGVRWALEVPFPNPGDQRAWDAMVAGAGWRYGVEGETAPRDVQALARRLQLKLRDGGVDGVLLVVPDTRRVREFLSASRLLLDTQFPVPGRIALARLARGEDPGGSSIIVL